MKLTIKRINGIESAMTPNSAAVNVDCSMTEEQMFDALCNFCEHITDATFDEWIQKLREPGDITRGRDLGKAQDNVEAK